MLRLNLALFVLLAGCGGELATADPSHVLGDEEIAVIDQEGTPADDVPVGQPVDSPDPEIVIDLCPTPQDCFDEEPGDEAASAGAGEGLSAAVAAGDKLITLRYAPMRKSANPNANTVAIFTGGGMHGNGHPRGVIPPGQRLTLVSAAKNNGFFKVRYKDKTGWVHDKKVERIDKSMHPIEFVRQAHVRDAFFLHQIRRGQWNKDGPLSSANCAPTSLAMAAKIFGKAGQGKTAEGAIHQARNAYGASHNENDGTNRSEIVRGAKRLGLNVQELGTSLSIEGEMDRIDKQLGWKRAVVLEGRPGADYRRRMTQAFRNNGSSRSYTYAENHSILGVSRMPNGNYIVADPISEVGMVTMNRSDLKSFFRAWGGTGTAVFDKAANN